jgi:hypothetical protein
MYMERLRKKSSLVDEIRVESAIDKNWELHKEIDSPKRRAKRPLK